METESYQERQSRILNAYKKASQVWKNLFPEYALDGEDIKTGPGNYLMCQFTDSSGRSVEARYQPIGDQGFQLMANMGDPLALVELKELLEKKWYK